ncbi:MAG: fused MFS/spermidine synthase [Chitinispirillaceae bacterium]|nr:fused MFS/spermidine synthase [Chitinispirillaceae bacterium]
MSRGVDYRAQPILLLLYFLSGAAALIYEIAWMRKLSLMLGGTVFAITLITASFMLGLALGSRLIGKMADAAERPAMLFAFLAAGIGVFGLCSPLTFQGLSVINTAIFSAIDCTGFARSGLQFTQASIALIVPTLLMGATFPVMAKAFTAGSSHRQRDIGMLCFMNTIGGALGCFVAGFYLVRHLGVNATIFCAAVTDLLVAGAAVIVGLKKPVMPQSIPQAAEKREQSIHSDNNAVPLYVIRLVLLVVGISGFCSLAYEVLWTKILTFFFLDSVYDFAIVLTAFLTGLAFGSVFFGAIAKNPRRSLLLLGLAQLGAGISAIAFIYLIQRLPFLAADLHSMPRLRALFGQDFLLHAMAMKFAYAFLIMLVPTFMLGSSLPLATGICAGRPRHFATDIGRMYMVNTLGAVAGSLTVCFALISLIGSRQSILMLAVLNCGAGLLILPLHYRRAASRIALAAGTALTVSLLVLALPPWDKIRMSASFFNPRTDIDTTIDLLFYKEDAHGVTSVMHARPLHQKFLVTNRNYVQNASLLGGSEDHRRLGHIPLFLHPNPSRVAVIGLGTGITLRGAASHELERLDCAEISGAVLSAAAIFKEENGDIINKGNISFIVNDGRNFLAETGTRYDVIIGDILFPMGAGAAYLFTTDYFTLVRKRLRPGGLACIWLPLSQFSTSDLRTIVASFNASFPHTTLWFGLLGESVPVLGCMGTEGPLRIDFSLLQKRLNDGRLVEELQQIGLADPLLFAGNYLMADREVRAFCTGAPFNTDDRPIIEFSSPLLAKEHRPQGAMNLLELMNHCGNMLACLDLSALPDTAVTQVKHNILLNGKVRKLLVAGIAAAMNSSMADAMRYYKEALTVLPGHVEASRLLSQTIPTYQLLYLSKGHASYDPLEALGFYRKIIESDPSTKPARTAYQKAGKILVITGQLPEAVALLDQGRKYFPKDSVLDDLLNRVKGKIGEVR